MSMLEALSALFESAAAELYVTVPAKPPNTLLSF